MTRPPSLPGFVPKGQAPSVGVSPTHNPSRTAEKAVQAGTLRSDFSKALEQRLNGWVAQQAKAEGSTLVETLKPFLKEKEVALDLNTLPERTQTDLVKLQGAAEGIEAIFIKKLLSQMRRASFLDEKAGPMADLAKDMMDQAIAEKSAKGNSSVGIARLVFLDTAQALVRTAIAQQQSAPTETSK